MTRKAKREAIRREMEEAAEKERIEQERLDREIEEERLQKIRWKIIMGKPTEERTPEDIAYLMSWMAESNIKFVQAIISNRLKMELLCRSIFVTEYEPGDVVITEGDVATHFYIILEGAVDIHIQPVEKESKKGKVKKKSSEDNPKPANMKSSSGAATPSGEGDRPGSKGKQKQEGAEMEVVHEKAAAEAQAAMLEELYGPKRHTMGAGTAFGEMGLIGNDNVRHASIIANTSPTILLLLAKQPYLDVTKNTNVNAHQMVKNFLTNHSLFVGVDRVKLTSISYSFHVADFPRNSVIMRQGGFPKSVFIVAEGQVLLKAIVPEGEDEDFMPPTIQDQVNASDDGGKTSKKKMKARRKQGDAEEEKDAAGAASGGNDHLEREHVGLMKPLGYNTKGLIDVDLVQMGPGTVFGERPALQNLVNYPFSAVAVTKCRVLELPIHHLAKVVPKDNMTLFRAQSIEMEARIRQAIAKKRKTIAAQKKCIKTSALANGFFQTELDSKDKSRLKGKINRTVSRSRFLHHDQDVGLSNQTSPRPARKNVTQSNQNFSSSELESAYEQISKRAEEKLLPSWKTNPHNDAVFFSTLNPKSSIAYSWAGVMPVTNPLDSLNHKTAMSSNFSTPHPPSNHRPQPRAPDHSPAQRELGSSPQVVVGGILVPLSEVQKSHRSPNNNHRLTTNPRIHKGMSSLGSNYLSRAPAAGHHHIESHAHSIPGMDLSMDAVDRLFSTANLDRVKLCSNGNHDNGQYAEIVIRQAQRERELIARKLKRNDRAIVPHTARSYKQHHLHNPLSGPLTARDLSPSRRDGDFKRLLRNLNSFAEDENADSRQRVSDL